MTLLITEQDIQKLLSIKATIPVIEDVFRMAGEGDAENSPRLRMTPNNKGKGLQFAPATLHAKQIMGFKVSTNFGSPLSQRLNFLYSLETGELLAIIQSKLLSKFRTGAATAVAVKYLSPPTASVVGMYGAGYQAEAQLEAICEVRPIKAAHVYTRTQEKREAFCRKMSQRLGIKVIATEAPEHVPREADIIVAMTNSTTPVLLGDWIVRPGLVVGAGANHLFEREIDEKLVVMAKLVVVDEKEHSKVEGGNLLWAINHGLLRWDRVEDLGDVVVGRVVVPDFYELARAQGVGSEISL